MLRYDKPQTIPAKAIKKPRTSCCRHSGHYHSNSRVLLFAIAPILEASFHIGQGIGPVCCQINTGVKKLYLLPSGLYRRLQNFTESAPIHDPFLITDYLEKEWIRPGDKTGTNRRSRASPLSRLHRRSGIAVVNRSPCPEGIFLSMLLYTCIWGLLSIKICF